MIEEEVDRRRERFAFQPLRAVGTARSLTTDTQLAVEQQGELHSNDSDFGRFPGLRGFDPLA